MKNMEIADVPDDVLKKIMSLAKKSMGDVSARLSGETEKIEKILPVVSGDSPILRIHIRDCVFELNTEKIMQPTVFKRMYFDNFHEVLIMKPAEWGEYVNDIGSRIEVIKEEFVTDEQFLVDAVLDKVVNSEKASEPVDAVVNEEYHYYNGGHVLYSAKFIKDIRDRNNKTIAIERLSHLLKKYLAGPSVQKRIGGKKERFWQFNIKIINEMKKGDDDD